MFEKRFQKYYVESNPLGVIRNISGLFFNLIPENWVGNRHYFCSTILLILFEIFFKKEVAVENSGLDFKIAYMLFYYFLVTKNSFQKLS